MLGPCTFYPTEKSRFRVYSVLELWVETLWGLRLLLVHQHVSRVTTGGTGLEAETATTVVTRGPLQSVVGLTCAKREGGCAGGHGPTGQDSADFKPEPVVDGLSHSQVMSFFHKVRDTLEKRIGHLCASIAWS